MNRRGFIKRMAASAVAAGVAPMMVTKATPAVSDGILKLHPRSSPFQAAVTSSTPIIDSISPKARLLAKQIPERNQLRQMRTGEISDAIARAERFVDEVESEEDKELIIDRWRVAQFEYGDLMDLCLAREAEDSIAGLIP